MTLILNKLKAGDIIQTGPIDYWYYFTQKHDGEEKNLFVRANPDNIPNVFGPNSILMFTGNITTFTNTKSPNKHFYECLIDNKKVYISKYILRHFTKIKTKGIK